MAGGSESRRSMASASVAAHRAEANVADARLARYNDRIGRVRKERAVWPGAAFIVEALLLLVFLTGSLAVLMNLNAEADRIGHESADLMDGLVLASNVAEEFAADPIAFKEAYEADPMADRWLSQPAHEVENGSDLLSTECTFRTEDTEAGTMHYLTLEVWKVRVLNDSAKAAEEGIGFAPGGLCFEKWEESPAYTLETSRYVPADGARTARSAAGAADDAADHAAAVDAAADGEIAHGRGRFRRGLAVIEVAHVADEANALRIGIALFGIAVAEQVRDAVALPVERAVEICHDHTLRVVTVHRIQAADRRPVARAAHVEVGRQIDSLV